MITYRPWKSLLYKRLITVLKFGFGRVHSSEAVITS